MSKCFGHKKQLGMTLLELLIALSIFSLVSVMAYGGLKTVMDSREGGERLADQLAEIELAFIRFERDFNQLVRRPVVGGYGERQSPWIGIGGEEVVVEFTWGGRPNPLKRARSNLARVRYQWEGEQWIRRSWQVLDRAQDSESFDEVILEGVELMEIRFLGKDGEWYREWVVPTKSINELSDEEKRQLDYPEAMEMIIDWKEWGRIRRIFLFPGVGA